MPDTQDLLPTPAFNRTSLLQLLKDLGISFTQHEHPPVFTVEEAQMHCAHLPGVHCKNLFLRNKKKRYWLVVLLDDTKVDLKSLGNTIEAGGLSFASPERLMEHLGVIPGAVTPLALVNDTDRKVTVFIQKAILDAPLANFHPLDNSATLAIEPVQLRRLLNHTGHQISELFI